MDMNMPIDKSTPDHLNVPMEMRGRAQWGYWKKGKIPCDTDGANMDHRRFGLTLEKAEVEYNPAVHAGVGFSFREEDPFVGIDYDHVVDENGDITDPDIVAEIQDLNSYTEVSQSGTGLHVICQVKKWPADLRHGTKKKSGELYYSGRYFALTGNVWKGSPTEIRTVEPEFIRRIYDRLNPSEETPAQPPQQAGRGPQASLSDEHIIDCLRNNARAESLYQGSISGYPSHSEADLALCNHIACFSKNIHQIDSIFRSSGLYRPKWNERRGKTTYGDITITEALRTTTGQYDPWYPAPAPEVDMSGVLTGTQTDKETPNSDDLVSGYQANKLQLDLTTLPAKSLIARYVDHMGKRSDSYPEYQYTGAMFVISTLIRRNGFVRFRHGTIYPNLWIMNLGASTISRKSTAVNSVFSLITDVMAGDTSLIDIRGPHKCEDSFSPEAFVESLAEHPVQYLILDECGQLLADMQKTYMANMRDLFCRIFDNTNYERRLRSKKSQGEKAHFVIEDPYFTTLMATTPDTLANHSDLLDLQSGWLLRYIYTLPTYPKEFKAYEPDDEDLKTEYDAIVEAFRKIRITFEQNTLEFCLSSDALATYQNWQRRMETTLATEGDEIKLSAFGRLADAAVKMAIIHTVGSPAFVDADHTLPCEVQSKEMDLSISHIEGYFLPVFCEVADLVTHRESKNLQDKIIGFLKRKGGKCTRTMLLRYLHRKAGDIDPELNTLMESEEIEHAEAKSEKGRLERWYILN